MLNPISPQRASTQKAHSSVPAQHARTGQQGGYHSSFNQFQGQNNNAATTLLLLLLSLVIQLLQQVQGDNNNQPGNGENPGSTSVSTPPPVPTTPPTPAPPSAETSPSVVDGMPAIPLSPQQQLELKAAAGDIFHGRDIYIQDKDGSGTLSVGDNIASVSIPITDRDGFVFTFTQKDIDQGTVLEDRNRLFLLPPTTPSPAPTSLDIVSPPVNTAITIDVDTPTA